MCFYPVAGELFAHSAAAVDTQLTSNTTQAKMDVVDVSFNFVNYWST